MGIEIKNSFFSKPFLFSLFFVQNKWHQHGVFLHTMRVIYYTLKAGEIKMIATALLHDLGKPSTAYVKDEEDKEFNEYSFTNHEEKSYQLIKNWFFISNYTKKMVRYHYLIRDMKKSYTEDKSRYHVKKEIWDSLSLEMQKDLETFLRFDDLGKGKKRR